MDEINLNEEGAVEVALPVRYVTFNDEGIVDGCYFQVIPDAHADKHIIVDEYQASRWVLLKLSEDKKSITEAPVSAPSLNITDLKSEVNEEINNWRLTVNRTSFNYDGKQIACDALSRSDLDGMAGYIGLFNEFPPEFASRWKAVDNTFVLFDDIQDFKDMYAAMVSQGNDNFIRAQTLKAQLAAASTLEEVEAVRESVYE